MAVHVMGNMTLSGLVGPVPFFELISWQSELLKQGFHIEGIAKNIFSQKHVFGESRVEFYCFFASSWDRFSEFIAFGTCLKIR